MKSKRAENSLDENSEAIEKQRAVNRVYMKNKRARDSDNSEAIEKKRAYDREYMRNKRAGESENSEAIEKKRAVNREYMRNKRAGESENSEAIEKKRVVNREYMRNKRAFGQLNDNEACNSNKKRIRICRESKTISKNSTCGSNKLQKSSGSSYSTHETVFEVLLPENLKTSKHNDTTIKSFIKELSNYPEYTCVMCKMLFFNHQVSEITGDSKNQSYVCKSVCQKHLFKNDYSDIAEKKFLYTGDLPETFATLIQQNAD